MIFSLLGIAVIIGAVIAFLLVSRVKITQTKTEDTIELGSTYEATVADYMTANKDKAMKEMSLDASTVNTSAVGDYSVPIKYKDRTYYVMVHVVDTTAPVVTAKAEITVNAGTEIHPSDVADVSDAEDCTLSFVENGNTADSLTMSDAGEVSVTVQASDAAGNKSDPLEIKVNVNSPDTTAPVISGTKNITLDVTDSAPDYMNGVTATDDTDGDITSSVTVDSTAVDMTKTAKYKVTYSVSDAAGNVSSNSITVTVKDKAAEKKAAEDKIAEEAEAAAAKKAADEAAAAAAKAAAATAASANKASSGTTTTTATTTTTTTDTSKAAASTTPAATPAPAASAGYPSFVVPTNGVDLAGAQTIYKWWKNKGYTDAQIQSYWGDLTNHYAGHGTAGW